MKFNAAQASMIGLALVTVGTIFANPFRGSAPAPVSEEVIQSSSESRSPASLSSPDITRNFTSQLPPHPLGKTTSFTDSSVSGVSYDSPPGLVSSDPGSPAGEIQTPPVSFNRPFFGGSAYPAYAPPIAAAKYSGSASKADDSTSNNSSNGIITDGILPGASPNNTVVSTGRTVSSSFPMITVSNTSVYQGSVAEFTITLDQTSLFPVTFNASTQDGTATAGVDYTARSGVTLTIPAGQTSTSFSVNTATETGVSGTNRTFSLVLSDLINAVPYAGGVGIATLSDPALVADFSTGLFDSRINFSRASAGTYYDASGVLRTSGANLAIWSEDVNPSTWTMHNQTGTENNGSHPSLTFTDVPGMSGNTVKQIANAGPQVFEFMEDVSGLANADYTFSVWVKDTAECSGLYVSVNDYGTWTGIVGSGPTPFETSNGWKRIWAVKNVSTGGARFVFYIPVGQTCQIGGAQFEKSSTPTPYAKTGAAPAYLPRMDYDPLTGLLKGLLIESSRTNLLIHSDVALWNRYDNAAATANITTAPDSTNTAMKLVNNTSNTTHLTAIDSISVTPSLPYTASVFVKAAELGKITMELGNGADQATATFDAVNGVVFGNAASGGQVSSPVASIEKLPNGWYRCYLSAKFSATFPATTNLAIYVDNAAGANTYAGNGTDGVYLWGSQLEEGTGGSSLIPTSGTAATRAADVVNITDLSWYDQSNGGTFEVDVIPNRQSDHYARSLQINQAGGEFTWLEIGDYSLSTLEKYNGTYHPTSTAVVTPNAVSKQVATIANQYLNVASNGTLSSAVSYPLTQVTSIDLTRPTEPLNGHYRSLKYYNKQFDAYALKTLSTQTDRSCKTLLAAGSTTSGIYTIRPDGYNSINAYCDMTLDGGGWTLVGRSVTGGSGVIGWNSSAGSVNVDTSVYSMGAMSAPMGFSEILIGNYSAGKTWGSYVYKKTGVPADMAYVYNNNSISLGYPAAVVGGNGNFNMAARVGYAYRTDEFYFRDSAGDNPLGLRANGWATYYSNGSPQGLTGYAGFIYSLQGMIMVR